MFSIKKIEVENFSFSTLQDTEDKCVYIIEFANLTNYSLKLLDEIFGSNVNFQIVYNELERQSFKLISLKLTFQLLFLIFLKLDAFNNQKMNIRDRLLFTSPGLGLEKYLSKST